MLGLCVGLGLLQLCLYTKKHCLLPALILNLLGPGALVLLSRFGTELALPLSQGTLCLSGLLGLPGVLLLLLAKGLGL